MVKEFKDFLLKQNIVALAIAVFVGTATIRCPYRTSELALA